MQEVHIVTRSQRLLGHVAVFLTMCVWATTYISTKRLLVGFEPIQILLVRTILGLLVLTALNPRRLVYKQAQDRYLVAAAGFCGLFLYYFLENTALTYSTASNVGVIVAAAPFFTFLASHLMLHEEKLRAQYFLGFAVAMAGISMIVYSGTSKLHLNPIGDLLALTAIMVWALYTVLTRIIAKRGYPNLLVTRTMFLYALVGFLAANLLARRPFPFASLLKTSYLPHFLFLGLVASAFCFLSWNFGLRTIGTIQSSFYLYLSPIITILFSSLFLGESLTPSAAIGTGLTLGGLLVSEYRRIR
ncbi:MAG: DMT family transporter [Sphaerochaeta sp.]|jgi:drug/metabolite transporter (DMT)-like permease|uniref:DMT family transporter n=1 Tax=Sphaerochaeta sp. TaxID=1972642 RepID=UPI002FC832E4